MTGAAYDAIAEWYDEYVQGPLYREIVLAGILELAGPIDGLTICDLACGQGMVTRALAERGARVTGVDLSARMLEVARRYEAESPLGIRYVQDNAERLTSLSDATFGGVTCSMALMTVDNLAATLAGVHRLLRPGGWFVFAITHPCFETPASRWAERNDGRPVREVARYFDERFWRSSNPDGVRGKVGEYHRTLSTYLNAHAAASFRLDRVLELRAEGERARQVPGNREVPSILHMRWLAPG